MRFTVLIVTLFLATSAAAQQSFRDDTEQPDFSRDTLLRLFAEGEEREDPEDRFRHRFGVIDFRAAGMRWRIGYLPFMVPLSGSQPWVNGQRWPDPFVLTGTEIAHTPRTWRSQRAMSAELRRIEKRVRETSTVRVQPD